MKFFNKFIKWMCARPNDLVLNSTKVILITQAGEDGERGSSHTCKHIPVLKSECTNI
jgi:hypothetical protein